MAIDYAALKRDGLLRQKQNGMFSLRLHVVGGYLTAENIKKIYEVAEKYGAGYVHLTARQSLEIPFIKYEDLNQVKAELLQGGCMPGAGGPRVRTVTACQGNVICSSGNIDAYKIAVELDKKYYGRELPHKFKFGITGCLNNCLKAEENDLGIKGATVVHWEKEQCIFCGICEKTCRSGAIKIIEDVITLDRNKCSYCGRCEKSCPTRAWSGKSGYLVSFGGLFGNTIHQGSYLLPLIETEEQLFRVTDAAIQFYSDYGKPKERFKFTIDRIGWDKFKTVMEEAFNNRG